MNKRLLISLFLIVMIVLVFTVVQNQKNNNISISENETPLSDGVDGSKTAIEFVYDMGAGWNLGNSFCCYDGKSYGEKTVAYYETLWGNPMTTKTTIHAIKAKGFTIFIWRLLYLMVVEIMLLQLKNRIVRLEQKSR